MKASEIISEKVYSIEEGNEIGYVLNLSLNKANSKLEYLVISSLYEENEMILNVKDIVSISDEAVFVNSEKQLIFDANAIPNNPIGKKVFSTSGDDMGRVLDVEISKAVVKKIITSSCEILPKNIYSSGKDCLFFSKIKKKARKVKENEVETKVAIQSVTLPYKQSFQGEQYIGKMLIKDVVDENHFLIFKKNSVVSPKMIIEAKKKHLLKDLISATK